MKKQFHRLISIFSARKEGKYSSADISALSLSTLVNYNSSGSALKAFSTSVLNDQKYRDLREYAIKRYFSSEDPEPKTSNPALQILLTIVGIGIRTGANISKNLEDFNNWLNLKAEKENSVRSKVNGMQILSLIGVVFFFPLFSGITASIVNNAVVGAGNKAISNGIRIIGIVYVSIILFITNSFAKPMQSLSKTIVTSSPLILTSFALQTIAYSLASYAI
ncbi:MAG: hypothetical protein ACREBF_04390 [Candidatus Micrarchaeales archaeon]